MSVSELAHHSFIERYEWARNTIIERGLTASQAAVLNNLIYRDGKACFPSVAQIAEDTGLSGRTVLRSLGDLRDLGIVTWRRRRGSSVYAINYAGEMCQGVTSEGDTVAQEMCQGVTSEGDTVAHKPRRGSGTSTSPPKPPSERQRPDAYRLRVGGHLITFDQDDPGDTERQRIVCYAFESWVDTGTVRNIPAAWRTFRKNPANWPPAQTPLARAVR